MLYNSDLRIVILHYQNNKRGKFNCLGAKYFIDGDGITLQLEGGWFFFEPKIE